MNSHLNTFRFYMNKDRNHQLENDLTRIGPLFVGNDLLLHELLREILRHYKDKPYYDLLFATFSKESSSKLTFKSGSASWSLNTGLR